MSAESAGRALGEFWRDHKALALGAATILAVVMFYPSSHTPEATAPPAAPLVPQQTVPLPATPAVAAALPSEMTRRLATGGCMEYVKQRLHDPGSAEFMHSDEATVILKGNRGMAIRSVRATNGFGAKRLSQFICFLELQGGNVIPVLIAQQGQHDAEVRALLKKWKM
jgi:hypothetical protein